MPIDTGCIATGTGAAICKNAPECYASRPPSGRYPGETGTKTGAPGFCVPSGRQPGCARAGYGNAAAHRPAACTAAQRTAIEKQSNAGDTEERRNPQSKAQEKEIITAATLLPPRGSRRRHGRAASTARQLQRRHMLRQRFSRQLWHSSCCSSACRFCCYSPSPVICSERPV